MSWNYQIVKTKQVIEDKEYIRYAIHEYFPDVFRSHGVGCTEEPIGAICFLSEHDDEENTEEKCVASIIRQLERMLKDAKSFPVLDGTKE